MQTSDLEAQAVIDSVSAAFPKHSSTVVQEVLQNGQFDVNEATDKLLKLKVSSRDKAQTRRRSTHFSGQVCLVRPDATEITLAKCRIRVL